MAQSGLERESGVRLHRKVRKGLPFAAFTTLQQDADLTQDDLLEVVGISRRTFERRRKRRRFEADESERILRVQLLFDLARRVLGSAEEARAWMHEPNLALGDETPIHLATTEQGARAVETTLVNIETGVYG